MSIVAAFQVGSHLSWLSQKVFIWVGSYTVHGFSYNPHFYNRQERIHRQRHWAQNGTTDRILIIKRLICVKFYNSYRLIEWCHFSSGIPQILIHPTLRNHRMEDILGQSFHRQWRIEIYLGAIRHERCENLRRNQDPVWFFIRKI